MKNNQSGIVANRNPYLVTTERGACLCASALADTFLEANAVLRYHGAYYCYDSIEGIWKETSNEDIKCKIASLLNNYELSFWTPRIRDNVMEALSVRVCQPVKENNLDMLLCTKKCIVNVATGEKHQFSSEYFFRNKCHYRYNKKAECPRFMDYLNTVSCGNKKIQHTLEEIMGYCLTEDVKAQKAFYLIGSGCNGKSVFIDVISLLVGEKAYTSLNIRDLESGFQRAKIDGKKVLLIADLSRRDSGSLMTAEMKKIISGDILSADVKYRNPYEFRSKAKVIFSSNFPLSFQNDSTHGAKRRIIVIPFRHQISSKEKDPYLLDKLKLELSGILNLAIKGYQRLVENGYKFSYTGSSIKKKAVQKERSLESFVKERLTACSNSFMTYEEIAGEYLDWCNADGIKAEAPLSKEIAKAVNGRFSVEMKKRNGKRGLVGIKAR